MGGALNIATICGLVSVAAGILRGSLPIADGSEYVRQMHLWFGYVSMAGLDALTIYLIRWHGKCYPRLTNPLTVILSLAILSHAFGSFSYAAGNEYLLTIYDGAVGFLTVLQLGVFVWWWGGRGRVDRRFHPRATPADRSSWAFSLRNNLHKARRQ